MDDHILSDFAPYSLYILTASFGLSPGLSMASGIAIQLAREKNFSEEQKHGDSVFRVFVSREDLEEVNRQ